VKDIERGSADVMAGQRCRKRNFIIWSDCALIMPAVCGVSPTCRVR